MAKIFTKYHYEKIWRETSEKDLNRIISEELPEAPVVETLAYILSSCKNGKTVKFPDISFKGEAKGE